MKRSCPFKRLVPTPTWSIQAERHLNASNTPCKQMQHECQCQLQHASSSGSSRCDACAPVTESHAGTNPTSFSSPTGDDAPIAATIFSNPPPTPKLVQLYSPSLRSVGPRCTPSAVSRRRCPVSAGSWWICGSTRPPSPHPSALSRAPVYLFAALLPLGPGTTLLIASRASCVDTRARARTRITTRARGGAGCQNGLTLPVVTVKLKPVLLTGEKWRLKEPLIYCESELLFFSHLAPLDVRSCFSQCDSEYHFSNREATLSPTPL